MTFTDVMTFGTDLFDRVLHQVHGSYGVVEPVVNSSGIYKMGKSELGDPPQSLKIGVIDQVVNNIIPEGNKAINGVVQDFVFIGLK